MKTTIGSRSPVSWRSAASSAPSMLVPPTAWSASIHAVAAAARSGHSPDLVSALGDSLSQLVALNETRIVAGLYARVPETVLLLLLAGSALSLGMVGYSAGIRGRRSILSALVMVVTLGVVLMIVIDLDRPQDGLINVSQQALVDTQKWVGLPSP